MPQAVEEQVQTQTPERAGPALESFYRKSRRRSREIAWRITRHSVLVGEAISRTDRELREGKTDTKHYFRALKMNARDLLKARAAERARFVSLDELLSSTRGAAAEGEGDARHEAEALDFASPRFDDQDPLEILMAREDEAERERLVQAAMRDPRWRYIKRRDWARSLGKCAESASRIE